jgi:hypothetical protein
MISLAEFIPIELVNHILSFRPRHPDACIIKNLKEKVLKRYKKNIDEYNNYIRFEYEEDEYIIPENINTMPFKELDFHTRYHFDAIFSYEVIPNSIYKIKVRLYKDSEDFYCEKYYTEKKAMLGFIDYYHNVYDRGDFYYMALVNIKNDTLQERILESFGHKLEVENTVEVNNDSDDSDDSSCGCGRGCETSDEESEEEDDGCRCGCYCQCGRRINKEE